MRVFVTGATGFIGSKLVPELIGSGHSVLGLTRSAAGEAAIRAAGAEPVRGDIEDLDGLRQAASRCDGVIHTAFDHDFANYVENCEKDGRCIAALGAGLDGSAGPLVITSGTAMGAAAGEPASEDHFDPEFPNPRIASELAGRTLSDRGVNVSVVRLAQIHDIRRQGLVTFLVELARRTGRSAYVGEGANRWSAASVGDAVQLFRLAFERGEPGRRYHAVAEEGVPFRMIAETLGRRLGLPAVSVTPEEADAHFGWLAFFADKDLSASSALTRERLGWNPTGPDLLTDLSNLADD